MLTHALSRIAPIALVAAAVATPLSAQSQADYDRQIEQLMNHPAVRSALDHIVETDDQTMQDLMTLTEIPAPPYPATTTSYSAGSDDMARSIFAKLNIFAMASIELLSPFVSTGATIFHSVLSLTQ